MWRPLQEYGSDNEHPNHIYAGSITEGEPMYRWECANCRCPITGSTFVPGHDGSGYAPVYTGAKDTKYDGRELEAAVQEHLQDSQDAGHQGHNHHFRSWKDIDTTNVPHRNTERRKEANADKKRERKLASMRGPDESERGAEDSDSSDDTSYTKGKKKGNSHR
jgi:hypothetical protein